MLRRFGQPESSAAGGSPVVVGVLEAVWFTFWVAMIGLFLGALVGLLLACSCSGSRSPSAACCRT